MSYLDTIKQAHTVPQLRWINIAGYQKSGKTEALVELAKHIPMIHIDMEDGTKPYVGDQFLHVSQNGGTDASGKKAMSIPDFYNMMADLPKHKGQVTEKICVIDPWTTLCNLTCDGLLQRFNVTNLVDHQVQGVGNGWNILYAKMFGLMQALWEVFPLVITVSHLKLNNVYKQDSKAINRADLALMGKVKDFTAKECDAHLIFTGDIVNDKFITSVNKNTSSDLIEVPLGFRNYEMFKAMHDSTDFVYEICKFFGKDIDKKDLFLSRNGNMAPQPVVNSIN